MVVSLQSQMRQKGIKCLTIKLERDMIQIRFSLPVWNIEEMSGYKPMTTFWEDFSIAERFGINAIKDTYKRCFKEWHKNYKYWTELTMVLNHKIWQHYESNKYIAEVYNELWMNSCNVVEKWTREEQRYFFQITD